MKCDSEVCAFVLLMLFWLIAARNPDQPCSTKSVWNKSPLCVCNARYCDTVIREAPTNSRCYIYMTSESGLRFKKITEPLQIIEDEGDSDIILELDPTVQFQTIEGFGGAITDSTGLNWRSLKDAKLMDHLIQSYCGQKGIEYNMLHVPIGGTDFSTHGYAYNELPEDDTMLSNFTLAPEDYEYKLPMIKACMKAAKSPVDVLTSSSSLPSWMMTDTVQNNLKEEYMQTYADYQYKFIEQYARQGVPIWAITTANEPSSTPFDSSINNLVWTHDSLNEWIVKNVGPTLRNSTFKNVKIIVGDDESNTLPMYWNMLAEMHPEMLSYLAGVATHFYTERYYGAPISTQEMQNFIDKFVISMVSSSGAQDSVDLGSWERAELYIENIIETLNNNMVGWMDWNMALNIEGGPSWTSTSADSPIIVNAAKGEFYKQPMFYAIGHFSKFIPRGSKRIQYQLTGRVNDNVQIVAFLTPKKTIVVVIHNKDRRDEVRIRINSQELEVVLKTKSITTIEMPYTQPKTQKQTFKYI